MPDYRWYQDVFIFRVMLRKDCYKPYWKEKFIDGLPPIFAHKVKQEENTFCPELAENGLFTPLIRSCHVRHLMWKQNTL